MDQALMVGFALGVISGLLYIGEGLHAIAKAISKATDSNWWRS